MEPLTKRLSAFDFVSMSPETSTTDGIASLSCYVVIKTGECELKSAMFTYALTRSSVLELDGFFSSFLAWALTAYSPLFIYCNCFFFCVSTGLILFRDNLRKHLGLSAPMVSRNARRVPPANIYKCRYRVAICSCSCAL